ncbi:MAG: ribosomal protein S18-alanine N-acetyltransferase [bacterium]
MPTPEALRIEPMTHADVDAVVAIEREAFSLPWSRRAFTAEVDDKRVSVARVARRGDRVVGYSIAWKVADELHIGNLAVARDCQGSGVGRALLGEMLAMAEPESLVCATLEVRMSNSRAIALYEGHGFRAVALRRRYYPDNGEDAMVMLKDFTGPEGKEAPTP